MPKAIELPVHKRPRVRKLLRQGVADVIANSQFYNQEVMGRPSAVNPCESECCLAGFIDWAQDRQRHNIDASVLCGWFQIERRIERLFDVSWIKIKPFKCADEWPIPFAKRFELALTPNKQALVLRDRVEHWFKTGE